MGQPQQELGAAQLTAGDTAISTGNVDHDEVWEYEYDDTETEDVYLTLDLTTHVPNAFVQAKREIDSGEEGRAQFLDLHTANPLIKFNEGIYECYWSTDLGSQFYIAQSGVVADPRRAGTVLDVVGVSRARLIGKPVTLAPRGVVSTPSDTAPAPPVSASSDPIANEQRDESERSEYQFLPGQPLIVPREECKSIAAERQASFLEKLSAIKLKKGETDPVPMYSVKYYHEPKNKDEIKAQALAADHEAKKSQRDGVAPDRPRKRRKRLTAVEKGLVPEGVLNISGRLGREAMGARLGITETGLNANTERTYRGKASRQARLAQEAAELGGDEEGAQVGDDDDIVMDEAEDEQNLSGNPLPGGQDAFPLVGVLDPSLASGQAGEQQHQGMPAG